MSAIRLQHGRVIEIPTAQLKPDPLQPRRTFLEKPLEELVASVKARGILQPITVRAGADAKRGQVYIVHGERRWRAAVKAGLDVVPCILAAEDNPRHLLIDQVVENRIRDGLNDLDFAEALQQLRDKQGLGPREISELLAQHGIEYSRSAVSNALRLLELPDWAKDSIRTGALEAAHARQILRAKGYPAWEAAIERRIAGHRKEDGRPPSVREIESVVDSALEQLDVSVNLRDAAFDPAKVCVKCPHYRVSKHRYWNERFCLAPADFEKRNADAIEARKAREAKKAVTPAVSETDPAKIKPRRLKETADGLIVLRGKLSRSGNTDFRELSGAKFDTACCAECPHRKTGSWNGTKDELLEAVCTLPAHFDLLQRSGEREASRRERFKVALDLLLLPHLQSLVAKPEHHRIQSAIVAYAAVGQPLSVRKPRGEFTYVPNHTLRMGADKLEHGGSRIMWNLGVALSTYRDEPAGSDPTARLARLALPLLHHEQRRELARFLGVRLMDFYAPTEELAKIYLKDELVRIIDPQPEQTGWKPSLPSRSTSELREMFTQGGQPIPPNLIELWDSPIGNLQDLDDGQNEVPSCRYCGCSHSAACELEDGPCAWASVPAGVELDADEGVCTNPKCLEALANEFNLRPVPAEATA